MASYNDRGYNQNCENYILTSQVNFVLECMSCIASDRKMIMSCSLELCLYDYQHIEAETKWTPFSRRHFEMDFLEWKCMHFD